MEKVFISFSGGVESTAMCLLYGKGATAIWVDTGAEHKPMYKRIDNVEEKLKAIHKGDFNLVRLKGSVTHKGEQYDTLEKLVQAYKFMPSPMKRYCTRAFKIEPIDKYLSSQGDCTLMIGLNADEENSRDGNWGLQSNVKYEYPLIEDGLTRQDCEDLLNVYGMHPNMPVYMSRGGCRMCFFKSEKEYRALYHLAKDEFDELLEFENAMQDKRKKFYSIMGNGKSLQQLAKECEAEKDFLKLEDFTSLYLKIKKETSCGAFCHR